MSDFQNMETDQVSGGQDVEASNLEFDLLAFVEENLMEDPNTQFPSNHPDQSETAGNYSTQEVVELGSSSGSNQQLINQTNSKQNLTFSTLSSDISEVPTGVQLEHAPNSAQQVVAFNPSLIETSQCYHPTTDFMETEAAADEQYCDQPHEPNIGSPYWNCSEYACTTLENPGPPVVDTPSFAQLRSSSFSTTLMGASQPFPQPVLENVEPRSSAGTTNQSLLTDASFNQNLNQSAHSSFESFNAPHMTAPNVGFVAQDGAGQSFQAENEASTMIYPNQMQMNAAAPGINATQLERMTRSQSLDQPNDFGANNQMLQNITGNNFPSISQQLPSLGPTLYPQNTIGVETINLRPLPVDQRRATLLPQNQNAPYRPSTQLGPQATDVITANAYDPQRLNFMLPQANYALSRPQQLSNLQLMRQPSQVSQVANAFGPQYQSMQPGLSLPPGPRRVVYPQLNQVPVHPNICDPQGYKYPLLPDQQLSVSARLSQQAKYQQEVNQLWTTQNSLPQLYGHQQQLNQFSQWNPNVYPQLGSSMLQEPMMLSGPQQVDHYGQSNPYTSVTYASNPQQNYSTGAGPFPLPRPQWSYGQKHQLDQAWDSQPFGSMLPRSSMFSRPQLYAKHQQLNQAPETVIGIDPEPLINLLPPRSSTSSGLQGTLITDGLQNHTARQGVSYLSTPGTNIQQTQIPNSLSQLQLEIEGLKTKVAVPDLSETLLSSSKEKGPVEGDRRAGKRRVSEEQGDTQLPSKRSRRETKRQETSSTPYSHKEDQDRTSLSQGTEVEKSNLSNRSQLTRRMIKNAVYDPLFEGLGLPVDPHLRLFSAS